MINILLNGESCQAGADWTVAELLKQRELLGKQVAVELNGEVLPRPQHAETPLHEGDVLELVSLVGGG